MYNTQTYNRCSLSGFMICKTCTASSMAGRATDQRKIKVADAAWWAVGDCKISLAGYNLAYDSHFYDRHSRHKSMAYQTRLENTNRHITSMIIHVTQHVASVGVCCYWTSLFSISESPLFQYFLLPTGWLIINVSAKKTEFNVKWPFQIIQGHVFGVSVKATREGLYTNIGNVALIS